MRDRMSRPAPGPQPVTPAHFVLRREGLLCPACGRAMCPRVLATRHEAGHVQRLVRCPACGHRGTLLYDDSGVATHWRG